MPEEIEAPEAPQARAADAAATPATEADAEAAAAEIAAEAEVLPPLVAVDPLAAERTQAEARATSGANWFFWITGLSILNSLSALGGSKWSFLMGLGTTQLVDAIVTGAVEDSDKAKMVALVIDLNVALIFALFGFFARRRYLWAFYVGMILYGLDALLFILARDVLSIGFHVFALYCIYAGFKATKRVLELTPKPAPLPLRAPGPPPGAPPR